MKILHIVTYISPDFAYGGPIRVALNQAKALSQEGHEVVVAAGAGGFNGPLPKKFDDFPVRLFPANRVASKRGFAGLVSPRMMAWLPMAMRSADVVHVHMARDLITLPAALLSLALRTPLVVQTHGMITPSNKIIARPLDALITAPVLRSSSKTLYLTDEEKLNLQRVANLSNQLTQFPNGVHVPGNQSTEQISGPSKSPQVLYLARLHPQKRPSFMVEAAKYLKGNWPNVQFQIIGPDEGEGAKIQSSIGLLGNDQNVFWEGALPPNLTTARMRQASIFAMPSVRESFGMSVIEAMAVGLPVVVTDGCGLAPFILANKAGIVCGQSQEDFTTAIEKLLSNPQQRIKMGKNGRQAVKSSFSMERVGKRLLSVYEHAIDERKLSA